MLTHLDRSPWSLQAVVNVEPVFQSRSASTPEKARAHALDAAKHLALVAYAIRTVLQGTILYRFLQCQTDVAWSEGGECLVSRSCRSMKFSSELEMNHRRLRRPRIPRPRGAHGQTLA